VRVLVLSFFMFLSAVSAGSSLILDPIGRLGCQGEKVGACEEFEDNNEGGTFG